MCNIVLALILAAIASSAGAGGNSNSNGPTTSGGDATAIAGAVSAANAEQKQAQGQMQGQVQGQVGIVKSQNSNAAKVVVQGDTVQAPDLSKNVPSMAFTTGNTTAHCIVAVGGSVAVAGFGGALTGGVVDDFCKRTWLIQYAESHGKQDVKQRLLCSEPMYAEADPSCWPRPAKAYGGGVGAQSFEALGGIGG